MLATHELHINGKFERVIKYSHMDGCGFELYLMEEWGWCHKPTYYLDENYVLYCNGSLVVGNWELVQI